MLEESYSNQINELLAKLPCNVQLPPEWNDYFTRQGMLVPHPEEGRHFPRKYLRTKAVLEITSTLPCLDRKRTIAAVYTKDISREGIGFVHSEQLFPGELARLWLTEKRLQIEVVRCNRIGSQCYVAGAVIAH